MILSFADKTTRRLFETGRCPRVPPDVARRAARKLEHVHLATCLDDLKVPPGNRLHRLDGDKRGMYAIRVNGQWRICFRFDGEDAREVRFCDYH